jgi:fructose-1,6-bisphosphatase II / sedoheptulose-1,7-bisphosphatase
MAAEKSISSGLILDVVHVTEAAAIAAAEQVGKGDEKAADAAAVEAMRAAFNLLDMDGTVVIGEGERDKAPMLYIGEKVGTGKGPKIDIALDPLEGTTITAKGMAGALAVVAFSHSGNLLNAPDTYMEKVAIGPGYPEGIIDVDKSAGEIARDLARVKGVPAADICACVLDRPRHDKIIRDLRELGCSIRLIGDGDIAGVMQTALPGTGVDFYIGTGGAPEGVLASVALRCIGGQFQGRLVFRNEDEKKRAAKWGITDLKRKYNLTDLARGDVIFTATGVTDGDLVHGVRRKADGSTITETVVLHAHSRTIRWVKTKLLG